MISNLKQDRSFFPTVRAAMLAGVAVAGMLAFAAGADAQVTNTTPTQTPSVQTTTQTGQTTDANGVPVQTITNTTTFHRGKKKKDTPDDKDAKVVQSKDTKKEIKKDAKVQSLAGVDAKLPDKQLYDKAIAAMNKGHFDVARLDLQTMLNTYPDSQYQMRAKLAIADSWYKEGGTAALTQAESEYADFRVFFPNAPEAAEAQMRIGDIYFRQMDKPDRDYSKALHAEEEYRRMLTDYPNAPKELTIQAKQRLREVQEVLASREADIASYYGSRENWAAVIAREQTIVDTYPLYSHMDDTLVALGDAYEAQARYVRGLKMAPNAEAGKAKLEQLYDGLAANCYRTVVLEHSAAPHVEDARDRLEAMGRPIPVPTAEQVAASVALENSRQNYNLANRAKVMFMHQPDTVLTAGIGDPSLSDPKITTAPGVVKKVNADFASAFAVSVPNNAPPASVGPTTAIAAETPKAATPAPAAAAPLALQDVGTGEGSSGGTSTLSAAPPAGSVPTGNNLGVSIVPAGTPLPPENAPGGGAAPAASPAVDNFGVKPTTGVGAAALPPVEKAADAPAPVNEVEGVKTPDAQTANAKGKNAKPEFDKKDESSSKHKKKKGLKKLDPIPQ